MGTGDQLKLLLWKDTLVRRRQLGVAALAFGWCIGVFLVLYIVRESVGPEYTPTCQYKARTLPSTGLFPFVQSFICNVDNKCGELNDYEEVPRYKDAKFSAIANQLQSAFTNDSVLNLVKSLPEMMTLLQSVGDGLDSPDLEGIFGSGVNISDFFDKPIEVKRKLRNASRELDEDTADNVFNASIKFGRFFKNFEGADISSAICDSTQLETYLLLKQPEHIFEVAEELCNINGKSIPSLLQNIISHADFSGLLKEIGEVVEHFKEYNIFDDARGLINVILRLNFIKVNVPENFKLTEWLPDVISEMKTLNYTHFDSDFIRKSLEIIETHFNETREWPIIKNLVLRVSDAIVIMQNNAIASKAEEKMISPEDLSTIVDDLETDLLNLANQTTVEENPAFAHFIQDAVIGLRLLEKFYLNSSDPLLIVANMFDLFGLLFDKSFLVDLSNLSFLYNEAVLVLHNHLINYFETEDMLYNITQQHSNTVSTLLSLGPDFIKGVTNCLSNSSCTYILVEHRNNISEVFCGTNKIGLITLYFGSIKNVHILCNMDLNPFVNDILTNFHFDRVNKSVIETDKRIYPHLNMTYDINEGNLTKAVINSEKLFYYLKKHFNTVKPKHFSWEQMFPQVQDQEWKSLINNAKSNKGLYLLNIQLSYLKDILKNRSDHYRSLNISSVLMEGILSEYELIPTSLVRLMLTNLPVIVDRVMKTFRNKTQILALTSISDWEQYFCDKNEEIISRIICETFEYIKMRSEKRFDLGPIIFSVNNVISNYDQFTNINWDEFFEIATSFYLAVEEIISFKLPAYNWQEMEVLKTKFWIDWIKQLDFQSEVRFGIQIAAKMIDYIDRYYFDMQSLEKWTHIQSVTSIINHFMVSVNELVEFTIAGNETNLDPIKKRLEIYLLLPFEEYQHLIRGIVNFVNRNESDIFILIKWFKNPCARNISNILSNFNSADMKGLLNFQDKMCNETKLNDLQNSVYISRQINSNDIDKEEWQDTVSQLAKVLHDVRNAKQTNIQKFNNQLQITRSEIVFERMLYRMVDKELEKKLHRKESLSDLFANVKQCKINCTRTQLDFTRYVARFASAFLNKIATETKHYLQILNATSGVDPVMLLGFKNSSAIYHTYLNFPDYLKLFVHAYRSPEFEQQIMETRSKGENIACSSILKSIKVPEKYPVTKKDLNELARYLCPSLFDWPILQDNIFLSTITKLQDYYIRTPVSQLNVSYVTMINSLLELKTDLVSFLSKSNITINKPWTKPWLEKLKAAFMDIKKLNFTSENTLTRLFKYIDEPKDSENEIFHVANPKFGFGDFSFVLQHVTKSLENIMNKNVTADNLPKNLEQINDLFEFYPKDVVGIFTYVYFRTSQNDIWTDFKEFCNASEIADRVDIFVPSWILEDKNKVLARLCLINYENITDSLFSSKELAKVKKYNSSLEEVAINFISTLLNFLDNNPKIHLSNLVLDNFNLSKILNGTFPSVEESRKSSLVKAHKLTQIDLNSKWHLKHDMEQLLEYLKLTTAGLKILRGGDWWNSLMNSIDDTMLKLLLQILERLPHVFLHLAEAATSPHLLYEVASAFIAHNSRSLCSNSFNIANYVQDDNIINIVHKLCTFKDNNFDIIEVQYNDTHLNYVLKEDKLAEYIFDFERTLIDVLKEGPKKFDLPKWANSTEIFQEYKDFEIRQKQPLTLLQTFIGSLTEIVDIGSLFYGNETNCKWCTLTTIFLKVLKRQLAQSQKYVDFMCQVPTMNFTDIRNTLLKDFKWSELENDISINKTYGIHDFDREMRDIIDVLRSQIILLYTNKTLQTNSERCFKNMSSAPALKNITTYILGASEVIKILKYASVKFFNVSTLDVSIQRFLQKLEKDIPIPKPLASILKSPENLDQQLRSINLGNSTVFQVMHSKIDVNQLHKITQPNEMKRYLLNRDLFNKLFSFNDARVDLEILNEIKERDTSSVAEILFNSVNKAGLDKTIVVWRNESLKSLKWLMKIFDDLERTILSGGSLLQFAVNINFKEITSGNFDPASILTGVLEIIQKNSIEKMFESLRELVKAISPIIDNVTLEEDLYNLVEGFENLEIFKNLGLLRLRYNISDIVGNWHGAKQYFMEEIHLNEGVVDDILNASLDLTTIISAQGDITNLKDLICNPEELVKIVTFRTSNPTQTASKIAKVICSLNMTSVENIVMISMKNMNFSKLLHNIMNSSVNNILTSAHMTEDQGKTIMKRIASGADLLPSLKNMISNVSQNLNSFPVLDKLQATEKSGKSVTISTDLLSSASTMLCGRPLVQASGKIYDTIVSAKDFNADKFDEIEQKSLPTEFCRDVYKDIVSIGAGKLIWAYIKPMIRGKFLYTPNVPIVKNILNSANTTFDAIAEINEILVIISNTLEKLKDTKRMDHILDNIQKFLNSSIVQIALQNIIADFTNSKVSLSEINLKSMLGNIGDSKKLSTVVTFGMNMLKCVLLDRFIGVESEDELEEEAKKLMITNEFIAGVVFLNISNRTKRSVDTHDNFTYKIRMDIDNVPTTSYVKYRFWTPGSEGDFFENLRYFRGFIQLQDLIDNAIIRSKSKEVLPVWETLTQQTPYPCWTRDIFKSGLYISQTFQVCFFFGFLAIVATAVRYVVWEKESGNTMIMNVMGLRYLTHCTSWFIVTFLELTLMMVIVFAITKAGGILPMTNNILYIIYLLEFAFSIMMFCYMVSSIFNSASLAAVGSAIFYLLSFMPYVIIVAIEEELPLWAILLTNLSMSTTFSYGCLYMVRYELQGVGLQWNNVWETPIVGDDMSFGMTSLFLLFDSILYWIIGYLISRQGQDFRKIFYFLPSWLVANNYYLLVEKSSYVTFDNELFLGTNLSGENYLNETIGSTNVKNDEPLKIGVTVKGLTKIYNSRKKTMKAINNIDITLYTGQVTTLLGHNGAGKTTLINILTGMMKPTSGQIIINSEITDYSSKKSRYLGVCPQASVLIDTMSPIEHLMFYAKLKTAKSTAEVMPEVLEMINNMSLGRQSLEPVSHLSEGTQRRLCVAIAFIGKPRLVVLDEPSSGVDPLARREIWDLIIRYKEGCTVLLTTHYLDEAELLSDRVVVLHKGKVLCSGSPLVLKHSYGSGYKLITTYPSIKENEELSENLVKALYSTVIDVIPNAGVPTVRGCDVNITLPFDSPAGVPNNYELLTSTLEKNQNILGFDSFSMNCVTLEQVFLDLCSKADAANGELTLNEYKISQLGKSYSSIFTNSVSELPTVKDDNVLMETSNKLTGSNLKKMCALLKKRAIHYIFDWRIVVCALVLPTVFMAIAMGFSLIRPNDNLQPPLKLTPELYQPYLTSFVSVHSNNPGSFLNKVSNGIVDDQYLDLYSTSSRECICEGGRQKCLKPSSKSFDPLLKLSSANETIDWLVETEDEYVERRYGGWSLSDQIGNKSALTVWYNTKAYHALPSYLNKLNNAILRTVSPESRITTYSHPLKLSVSQLSQSTIAQHIADVGIAIVLLIGISLVPASGSIYLVQERVNEEKRLQFLCGVSPVLYWIVAFIWDVLMLLFALILAVIVFKIFGLPVYVARQNTAAVSLLIFLYGWACIPFVHLMQRIFTDPSLANMILFWIFVFTGVSQMTCILLMDILGKTQFVADLRNILYDFYLIFPPFVLGDGLIEIAKNNIQAELLTRFHMDTYLSPLGWELMGRHYLSLLLVGFILIITNLILENQWFRSLKEKSSYSSDTCCLETVNLSKEYNTVSGKNLAVDNLSLKVPFGQCLGLIGVNGAGKSTTFKMLTAELQSTSGAIFLQGREICRKPLCTGEVGYCAQCNSLDPKLTVRQTLDVYLTLRGIDNIDEIAQKVMKKFEVNHYSNRRIENLSGGNKRKLCTALAILGNTSLILMDEPTSGMDPYSRTLVGLTIQQLIQRNRSVILTSHSVEDCETLCSAVAIMINGKVICQGTPQDLKERYGAGYIISVRLTVPSEQDMLLQSMQKYFPGAELVSRQYCSSQFSVPTEQIKVSEMFNKMAKISESISVEDYNLVRSSLDQVFINLTNKSNDNELKQRNSDENKIVLPNNYVMSEL